MLSGNYYFISFLCLLSVSFSQCYTERNSLRSFECKTAEEVCPNDDITFWLYTRTSQENPTQLDLQNIDSVNSDLFTGGAPVIILIHGYTGNHNYSPNSHIRPALFERGEYNVISVDYGPIAESPCYLSSVRNLKVVANCTAQLIDHMVDQNISTLSDFHPIGFSLGAHVVGMIANYLNSGKLSRITALDPAKPLFITAPPEDRIDPGDADFVDVIHTDVLGRGLLLPTGHVDFYMNGGFTQPGCMEQTERSPGSCNHDRAPLYFAESINSPDGFWGYRCLHWYAYVVGLCKTEGDYTALMGMHTPNSTRGMYFVWTNKEPPYARGREESETN